MAHSMPWQRWCYLLGLAWSWTTAARYQWCLSVKKPKTDKCEGGGFPYIVVDRDRLRVVEKDESGGTATRLRLLAIAAAFAHLATGATEGAIIRKREESE
jgi:hypothetical protein